MMHSIGVKLEVCSTRVVVENVVYSIGVQTDSPDWFSLAFVGIAAAIRVVM